MLEGNTGKRGRYVSFSGWTARYFVSLHHRAL